MNKISKHICIAITLIVVSIAVLFVLGHAEVQAASFGKRSMVDSELSFKVSKSDLSEPVATVSENAHPVVSRNVSSLILVPRAYLAIMFFEHCVLQEAGDCYENGAIGNNSFETAYSHLSVGSPYTASLYRIGSGGDRYDYYTFQLSSTTAYTISLITTTLSADIDLYVYQSDKTLVGSSVNSGAGVTETKTFTTTIAGTYFILVNAFNTPKWSKYEFMLAK